MKSYLFIQPIVSHYRKSLVEEILKLEPNSQFWGTANYNGVKPLINVQNVDNSFKTVNIKIFKIRWFKNIISKFLMNKSTHIIISGINPLLVQTFVIFLIANFFTSKKIYWWSQGKKFGQGFIGKKLRKLFYKYSDGIFLYSEQGRINFLEEGLPNDKLFVINNCLNYEDYGWLNYSLEDKVKSDFRIIYSGRLSQRKKVIILLKAFKILKNMNIDNIYLDIIGEGEEMDRLKSYAETNHILSYINFVGGRYGVDAHKYFLNGDLIVCPGAVGLSIVHGFSFGLPLLTGKGDLNHSSELELLTVNKTGDYFLLDDFNSLAEKIIGWKEKLLLNKNVYQKNCIRAIEYYEYLPNLVAKKLVEKL